MQAGHAFDSLATWANIAVMGKFTGYIDGSDVSTSSDKPFILRFGAAHEKWPNSRREFDTLKEMREFQESDGDPYAYLNQHLEFKEDKFVQVEL